MIEKNSAIDSRVLAQVLNPQPCRSKQGTGYRIMKITGSIAVSVSLGLWAMCLFWLLFTENDMLFLGGPATMAAIIGAGVLFAARFMPRPSDKNADPENVSVPRINEPEL